MKRLHLHLRAEYFDQIKAGTKTEEYRAHTAFYARLLARGPFTEIVLYRGYPPAGDHDRILRRPWLGHTEKIIHHPHFGPIPIRVFAIPVN